MQIWVSHSPLPHLVDVWDRCDVINARRISQFLKSLAKLFKAKKVALSSRLICHFLSSIVQKSWTFFSSQKAPHPGERIRENFIFITTMFSKIRSSRNIFFPLINVFAFPDIQIKIFGLSFDASTNRVPFPREGIFSLSFRAACSTLSLVSSPHLHLSHRDPCASNSSIPLLVRDVV